MGREKALDRRRRPVQCALSRGCMIELESVSKKFGAAIALHETDLRIEAGKTTVLIGASGCGKSTILRLIVGLLEPTTGTLKIEGQLVSASSVLALRRRIGYVIQEG